jgi:hypothetical protein
MDSDVVAVGGRVYRKVRVRRGARPHDKAARGGPASPHLPAPTSDEDEVRTAVPFVPSRTLSSLYTLRAATTHEITRGLLRMTAAAPRKRREAMRTYCQVVVVAVVVAFQLVPPPLGLLLRPRRPRCRRLLPHPVVVIMEAA